jgi:DNA-binding GntR family transcriptional regulator
MADLTELAQTPLDTNKPSGHQIAHALRQVILTMQIPPGSRLSEGQLGRHFGASRTPVREALTLLRDEGLIVTQPSRGTFVTRLSVRDIKGAHAIREALELTCVQELCRQGLDAAVEARLAHAIANQHAAIAEADREGFHHADDAFHRSLCDATGLGRIGAAITREKTVLDRVRTLRLHDEGHLIHLANEHARLLDAIRASDSTQATHILQSHLAGVLEVLETLRQAHADYFE